MLKILLNEEWVPIQNYQSYYIDIDEEGNQSMQFVIPLDDMYYKIKLEGIVQDDFNCWLVKGINQLATSATIICDLDMDAWRTDFYLSSAEIEELQTKTIVDALNYIKPSEWKIQDKSGSKIKRTLDLEKCTAYDLLMRAKTVFDVQYDIDTLHKCITIINPYEIIDSGVYVTPELNMKSVAYKGDSQNLITRLYCYGADNLTFAPVNEGKPYIENTEYKGSKVLSASWTDGRYTNMESLLEDGRKKLKELSVPTGSYTVDVVDLQAIEERYEDLELALRSTIHCIVDPERRVDVVHRVVKKRIYPDEPSQNKITLSNEQRTIEKEWDVLKENVETVRKDGYRYETEIRQNNKEIVEVAKRTDENTNNIQSVEEKITPEQLLVTVSNSINSGNKLNTVKFIVDINGIEIRNGGIKVYDANNNLVMFVDEKTKKLTFNGDISGDASIKVGTDLYVGDNIYLGNQLTDTVKSIYLNEKTYITLFQDAIKLNIKGACLYFNDNFLNYEVNGKEIFNISNISGLTLRTFGGERYFQSDDIMTVLKGIRVEESATVKGNLWIDGNMTVKGSKNRAVMTCLGNIKMNAVESADCRFTDEGQITLDEDGKGTIFFDAIWLETVNTELPYHVQLTPYCEICPWIVEEHPDKCIIAGMPNTKVNWHVSAYQKGYENTRLEKFERGDD